MRKELIKLKKELTAEKTLFQELERDLRLENSNLQAKNIKLSEEYATLSKSTKQSEIEHIQFKLQAENYENLVLELNSKTTTLKKQVQTLVTQLDDLRRSSYTKSEELSEKIQLLQSERDELQTKLELASCSSDGQTERELVLQRKIDNLSGKSLEKLSLSELEQLEEQNHAALQLLNQAKVRIFHKYNSHVLQKRAMMEEIQKFKKMTERLQEEKLCSVCIERGIDVVLLPCKHRYIP